MDKSVKSVKESDTTPIKSTGTNKDFTRESK